MAILAFQKPDKVIMLEADSKFGKFEFRPLEPGFGITIGNALRRILLSSLEGFAINTINLNGIDSKAFQRRKENATESITDSNTETGLKGTELELTKLRVGLQHDNFIRFLKC